MQMNPVANSIVPFPATTGNGNGGKATAAPPASDENIHGILQPLKTFG